MKKLLVVGGTGVLSSAIVETVLQRGFSVTMINRGKKKIPQSVILIQSDKNNYEYIKRQLGNQSFDSVIDFLCFTPDDVRNSFNFYSKYTKQFFLISSCAVYDKISTERKHVESDPKPLQIWDYSVNKWKAELELHNISEGSNCYYTIVRPSITYGNTRIPYGISPKYGYHWTLAARVLANKPIITWNGGRNHYNMLRVEDFAIGLVGLIGNPKAYNEAFNICSDDTPTFYDVLSAMGKALNHDVLTIDVSSSFYAKEYPERSGEILGGRAQDEINSNDKVKTVVPEFAQTISLDEGIKMTIDAYRKQNYQLGIDWRFDADTDRIIKKWCKSKGIDYKKYNLGFMDYLNNASLNDKYTFYEAYWGDVLFVKIIKAIKGGYHRFIMHLHNIFKNGRR